MPKSCEEDTKNSWYDSKELSKLRRKVGKLVRKGVSRVEATDDCWRGLETFAKEETEEEEEIIKDYKEIATGAAPRPQEMHIVAQKFLEKVTLGGTQTAAKDAADAYAIYMETMDPGLVQAFFPPRLPELRHARGA